MANLSAPMPSFATPFLKDGLVNEPWYRFLFQLQVRTGGAGGSEFVTETEFQKLVNTVLSQDLEINGLTPTAPVFKDSPDAGSVPMAQTAPDLFDLGAVQFPVGTMAQQNADNVSISGGAIDGTPIGAASASTGAFSTVTSTTSGSASSVLITDTGANGANLKLAGNGGTTPSKTLRAQAGKLELTNDAYSNVILSVTDAGNLVVLGSVSPSQTGGIIATTTNNNANAGSVGEYITSVIGSGSAVSLTTGTAANVTSITLTPGDWDVSGVVEFTPAAGTAVTYIAGSSGTTSATHNAQNGFLIGGIGAGIVGVLANPIGTVRYSVASNTTVYLVAQSAFSGGTMAAYGFIGARRAR